MRLYTRTGDDGTTGLFDGSRVSKDHPRVAAYGDVDELNAHLGAAVAAVHAAQRSNTDGGVRIITSNVEDGAPSTSRGAVKRDPRLVLAERLTTIQHELFTLGAELATPLDARNRGKIPETTAEQCRQLEFWIDEATASVPELRMFILPAGDEVAARLHVCRTVCRRAERAVVTLAAGESLNPQVVIYLNRLSDLLFAWARWANKLAGNTDVPWHNPNG